MAEDTPKKVRWKLSPLSSGHVHKCVCTNMCPAAWVCAMYFNEWMGRIVCVGAVLAGGGGGGGVDVGAYSSCYRNIPGIDLWLTVLHLHLSGVSVSSVLGSDALVLITVEQRRWGDSICIGFRGGFCAEMMEEEIYSGPWRQQISPQGQLYSKGDTLDSK